MTTHTSRRGVRRRLAAWTLLPLVVLAGCGGNDADPADTAGSPGGGSGETQASSDKTYDAETVLPAMRQALADAKSARVQVEMSGAVAMTMDGRMEMAEDPEAGRMELTAEINGQQLDLRLVDGFVYLSGAPLTDEGKWVKADLSDPEDPAAEQFAGMVEGFDLNSTFDSFEAGLRDVEHVGEEEIDGEPVDHYEFTVDAAAAMEAGGQEAQPALPDELTYDVWLTGEDLMRRVSFDLGPVKAVIDATEWGEPVDVEAPDPADIVERPAP